MMWASRCCCLITDTLWMQMPTQSDIPSFMLKTMFCIPSLGISYSCLQFVSLQREKMNTKLWLFSVRAVVKKCCSGDSL